MTVQIVDEDYVFDGAEQFAYESSSIVEMLEEHQNYFERIGDQDGEETILTFMMWLENKASDMEEYENYMRQEDIIASFEENILPGVVERYGKDDEIAIRTAFNDYTDALCKDGQISEWQYSNGDNPY